MNDIGQMLINFRGPAKTFPTYSAATLSDIGSSRGICKVRSCWLA